MAITLNHMMYARDAREERQRELLEAYPGHTLLVVTVDIPGAVKRSRASLDIGYEALRVLFENFGYRPAYYEVRDEVTGFEAMMVVPDSPQNAKVLCADLERRHPLGQIFHLDVIDSEGKPVEMRIKGEPFRRCIICGGDARACRRLNKHTPAETNKAIEDLHREYFHTL